jgi:hypothetical protein
MTIQEISNYYNYHNENIKLLKIGFDNIRNQIKNLYHTKNKSHVLIYSFDNSNEEKIALQKIEKSLSRILSGIQVSWAEESIKRLLYEKNVFTDIQISYILKQPALDQRWYITLKIIFSIAYELVPVGDETCETVKIEKERKNLGNELVNQYIELRSIITNHLVPNFSIRNKVQHGEWENSFEPPYSAKFSQSITDKVNNENIITTTSRYTLVNAFYQMLIDLGRFKSDRFALDLSTTPFEYFYKKYMRKIKFEVEKINNPNLETHIKDVIEKEIRGQQYRNK